MKRLLTTWILALLATVSVWAQTFTAGNLTYKVTDAAAKTVELTGYETEPTGALTIPATVTNGGTTYSVTAIGRLAFRECKALTSVTIPDGVTSIGSYAFSSCEALTAVTIPDGVTEIQTYTFAYCYSLKSVTIGKGVTGIELYAFGWSDNISELTVAATVPPTVKKDAFYSVSKNISVYVPKESLAAYKAADGWKEFTNLKAIGSGFTAGNLKYAVTDAAAKTVELTGYVTKPTGALTIPATVTNGGTTYSVTAIGYEAFRECKALTSVTIPDGVTSIVEKAFMDCETLAEVNIPKSVTSIGGYVFSGCKALTSVTIPDGVTSIGEYAFSGCKALTAVTTPDGVTSIGYRAFYDCMALTTMNIPESVTSISGYAFSGCKALTAVTIPDGVTEIQDNTFAYCTSLKSVTIGSGVTAIGEKAFYYCDGITEMTVLATVPPTMVTNAFYRVSQSIPVYVPLEALDAYKAADGWKEFSGLQAKGFSSFTVDNLNYRATGLTAVELTGYVTKPTGILDIPATVSYEGKNFDVTAIGESAFRECKALTLLTIPNTVKTIGVNAFYLCTGILELTIPDSVTKIGINAFGWCSGLLQLTIGNGVTDIERIAFKYCKKLQQVTLGNNVATIGDEAFGSCEQLKQISIPESVTDIGAGAFGNCPALTAITVAEGNTAYCSDGGILFSKDKTTLVQYPAGKPETSYTIPAGVTAVQGGAFSGTALTSVTIPESVTVIGSNAFYLCEALTAATVPDGVTSIENGTFSYCTALTKVTLGNGVTNIGTRAFSGCTALAEMTVAATEPPVAASDAFENVSRDITVNVPAESLDTYKAASVWSEFTNLQPWSQITFTAGNLTYRVTNETAKTAQLTGYATAPEGALTIPAGVEYDGTEYSVTSIGNKALAGCELLTEAVVPNSVATIGNEAFADSKALAKVTLGDGVATMGNAVFRGCESLTEAVIPDGVTTLGAETFSGCTKLSKAVLGNGVKALGEKTFYGCTLLAEITVPDGVTTIGSEAFSGCTSLAEITVPDAVTTIGNSAFSGCTKLTAVALGNGVSNIGDEAFSGCTALTEITLPNSVRLIGKSAFSGCSALEKATLGSSVRILSDWAFYGCEALAEMTVLATEPPMASANTFENVSRSIPVYVPKASLEAYRAANVWNEFNLKEPPFVAGNLKYSVSDASALTVEVIGCTDNPNTVDIPATVSHDGAEYRVTGISGKAFAGCDALTQVNVGINVTDIAGNAFAGTALAAINVDGGNTAYSSENGVLFDKAKTALLLYPWGKTDTSYSVPDGVTAIGREAAAGCTSLTELTLAESVATVGEMAFAGCTSLTQMTVKATVPPTVEQDAFMDVDRNIPVYVHHASLDAYRGADTWREFNLLADPSSASTLTMPDSLRVYGGMLRNPEAHHFIIYDLTGRIIYSGNATTLSLTPGIYVVSCNGANGKAVF